MLTKFFEIAAPESTGTTSAPSIASLMASAGVINNTGEPIAQPIVLAPEKKEEQPTPAPEAPVATTTASPAEQAKPESPTPTPEPTTAPAVIAPEPVKVPTWQEVLKSQQPEHVFRELGYSDDLVNLLNVAKDHPQMKAFLQYWASNGNTVEYLREANTDYTKMPAEEVMRHQLRREYPKATEAQLNVLYQREVIKAYSLDSDEESEREEGRLLLEAKADRHRDEFITNQQKYLLPKAPEPKAVGPDPQELARQEEAKKITERYHSQMSEDPFVKNIVSTNKFVLGEGEEAFTYPVESKKILDYLYSEQEQINNHFNFEYEADGKTVKNWTPKAEHQMMVGLVGVYGKDFLTKLQNHFLTVGSRKAVAPIENASQSSGSSSASEPQPKTPAEAMAKHGRLVG